MALLLPDLLYRNGAFERDIAVEVTDGRISGLVAGEVARRLPHERLHGRALLPGFVNAHSHSFQRVFRGRTQWRPRGPDVSDFWSWRESMYNAVLAMSPDALYHVARLCFLEMLQAGYTTVGEFHYVQRDEHGRPYDDPNEIAHRIIAAAESVGIRISLLNVCYATGGVGESLRPEQRRFNTPDPEAFAAATTALRDAYSDRSAVTVGMAPHSLRAVPREWLQALRTSATSMDMPFHMHVAEQPAEVDACVAEYGIRPVELLHRDGLLDDCFTAVHATHLTRDEVRMLGDARAAVCLCPTTERDLGDGLPRATELRADGVTLCVGTDSQSVIEPLEEIRLIEYNERLRLLRRVMVTDEAGDRLEVAPALLNAGTAAGARSLRLETGSIEAGSFADFAAVDLEHHALTGWRDDSLAALIALAAPAAIITDCWVGGVRRVDNGQHALDADVRDAYRAVLEEIA